MFYDLLSYFPPFSSSGILRVAHHIESSWRNNFEMIINEILISECFKMKYTQQFEICYVNEGYVGSAVVLYI